ncbi:MAG: DMT family transporter, partial [Deltaproteobacteria bacterium]|nr:DMT family transporter [Deltaproteobacteria bacterium]
MITNILSFLLLGTFWGGSFVAIKIAVGVTPPIFAALLRVTLSLVFLLIIFRLWGKPTTIPPKARLRVWTAGLFLQGLPFLLLFWGEKSVTPGIAGILNGTTALWTFLLAAIFFRHTEHISIQKLIGMMIALTGLVIIFWPKIFLPTVHPEVLGTLAVTGMALCYGIGTVMSRALLASRFTIPQSAMIIHQHFSSLLLLFVATIVFEGVPNVAPFFHSWRALTAVLYLSLCSTAIAWIIFFSLLGKLGSVRTSSITYLIPLVAVLGDFLYFGRIPAGHEVIGALTILAGVALIQLKNLLRSSPALTAV